MADFNWTIKAEDENGKRYEFEVSADGKFRYINNVDLEKRKFFTKEEMELIKKIVSHMNTFSYVELEAKKINL